MPGFGSSPPPPSPEFSVGPATDEELPHLTVMAARLIPSLQGTCLAVERVHRHCRSIFAVRTRRELVGCFAALLLNASGFEALLNRGLSTAEPRQSQLVPLGEPAEAIYVWAICGLRMSVQATGNVMQWLKQSVYTSTDLYATPGTPKGKTFMIRTGSARLQIPRRIPFGFIAAQRDLITIKCKPRPSS